MASVTIKVEMRTANLLNAMTSAADNWPQSKRDQFAKEWQALEDAGAVCAEVQVFGGRVVGHPSEDLTKHCEKWGIFP
jgi:hypothetical protein